ncbi:MAG: DegT/DnrJ/EryC1/StrS aminotransferase family protein, partial [Verrucomicrobia bacterium]
LKDTWCIDPKLAEEAITPRTKAIIAVHLYGNMCDMSSLLAVGDKHGVPVVEDAAEAIGSETGGRKAGSLGRFGAFSFHGTKTLTTGEGGMLVTDDTDLYNRVMTLSNHGRAVGQCRQFWPVLVGFKFKMSNIQAAIGCAQVERVGELTRRKREILGFYRSRLALCRHITLNPELAGTLNGAWMPTAVFDRESGVTREGLLAAFASENTDARVFFWPLSGFPFFESKPDNRNAWDIPKRAINLPSYHDIGESDLERVCRVLENMK